MTLSPKGEARLIIALADEIRAEDREGIEQEARELIISGEYVDAEYDVDMVERMVQGIVLYKVGE